MNCINFREIEERVAERSGKIRALWQEMLSFVMIDGNYRLIIDEGFRKEAMVLVKQVNQLRKANLIDLRLMERARALANEYGLPIDRSGSVKDRPERLDLEGIEREAVAKIERLNFEKQHKGVNGFYFPNVEQNVEERLAEVEKILVGVKAVRAALAEFEAEVDE